MGLASLRDIFTREKLPGSIIGWDDNVGGVWGFLGCFGLGFFFLRQWREGLLGGFFLVGFVGSVKPSVLW